MVPSPTAAVAASALAALLLISVPQTPSALKLDYDAYDMIPMKSYRNLSLRLSFDEVAEEEENWPKDQYAVITFGLSDHKSWAIDVLTPSLVYDFDQIRRRKPQEVTVKGVIIGINDLEAYGYIMRNNSGSAATARPSYNNSNVTVPSPDKYLGRFTFTEVPIAESTTEFPSSSGDDVVDGEDARHFHLSTKKQVLMRTMQLKVIVEDPTLNKLFTLIMTLLIIFTTINMGGQLDLEIIKEVFKKPIGPAVGFVSQFLLMPLFSFGVGWLMSEDKLFRLGLFVLGCCPGGTGSNFWCLLLGGDINLSMTMTFISTVCALGMMPLWLYLMGGYLTDGDLVIPYGQLIVTLLLLVGPVALGMWIRYRSRRAAFWMKKGIIPVTLFTIVFILTVGVYINLYVFQLITGKMVLAGFIVAGAGYLFGGVMAWICRLNFSQIIAVSIETAFQNGGIAFILLKVSMEPPFGEMACVAPVAQLVITGTPLWLSLFVWKLFVCYRNGSCRGPKEEVSPMQQTGPGDSGEYSSVPTSPTVAEMKAMERAKTGGGGFDYD